MLALVSAFVSQLESPILLSFSYVPAPAAVFCCRISVLPLSLLVPCLPLLLGSLPLRIFK